MFWKIVDQEMDARRIRSYRALEMAGGVSNGAVSARRKDLLPPTPTTIQAVADAFRVPVEVVREWAKGRQPEHDDAESEWLHLFRELPAEERRHILISARALLRERLRGNDRVKCELAETE